MASIELIFNNFQTFKIKIVPIIFSHIKSSHIFESLKIFHVAQLEKGIVTGFPVFYVPGTASELAQAGVAIAILDGHAVLAPVSRCQLGQVQAGDFRLKIVSKHIHEVLLSAQYWFASVERSYKGDFGN